MYIDNIIYLPRELLVRHLLVNGSDGKVKVYIETPDEKYCFKHATCWLPAYEWEDIFQYSDEEIARFDEIIHSMAHLIMEFSQEGGFDNASNF